MTKHRILIVDDDNDMRSLADHILRLDDFDTATVEDGDAALAALGTDPMPDAILLDVQMPGTSGWETLAAIRSQARTAAIAVVFSTVKAHPRDALQGWRFGCDGYITKPYDIAELPSTLRAAIDRDSTARERLRAERIQALEEQLSTST